MSKFSPEQIKKIKEIGSYLQSQRLEKSISLEKIASDTFIRREILEAMENGDLEKLPELVYLRGFICRYAKIIQVDGESLVKDLNQTDVSVISETPQIESSLSATAPPAKNLGVYLLYVVLLAGAVYGLSFLFKPSPIKQPSSSVVTKPASPSPTNPTPKLATTPTPKPKPTTTPTPTPSPQALSATLNLETASWVRIKVDGKTAFEGVLSKGTKKTWQAKKQLVIRAGNAGAVKLSKNQEPAKLLGNPGEVKEVTLTR